MTDTKELIERARYLCGWMHNGGEWDQIVRQALSDTADWIERWAPVIEAARAETKAADAVVDSHNAYTDTQSLKDFRAHGKAGLRLRNATKTLRAAVAAALGEDKP